ncbi:hypothetical protein ACF1A9_19940 [Streptomyces sp. NPDC014872]|uniref:hypothetical protein n=1 Tax=Streptomyces sp. NPDC014872 TaxID=3364926 RepID=UPI0036FA4028
MAEPTYTRADLRAEAARQHFELTRDPDHMGVGESMGTEAVPSTNPTHTWEQLLPHDADDGKAYSTATGAVHDLISRAVNLSTWAVEMGVDGLKPSETAFTVSSGEQPIGRIHLAFGPGMSHEMRSGLIASISHAVDAHLRSASSGASLSTHGPGRA